MLVFYYFLFYCSTVLSSKPEQDTQERAQRLTEAIAFLEACKREILAQGEVAPPACCVARYQAKGKRSSYWYYKLQASVPTFPTVSNTPKLSRYKHLGKAGSASHVEAVIQVVRRTQIDELDKAIAALKYSWSELYSDRETVGHRVEN